ncbi:acyl-CoA thioesterase [Antrihabitans cavernicola]|uniref:Acyl-CoA thioesterase n=1 Tax=Antrihabitans cavernicola TaxID=2495913 RepID=A0A5A7SAD8_9NOCA|nr:acyl-CoA thioesterase [Spelaeibacter cavernicola]KAA0022886.1 acyl-CoA thioesterase [Spelaeibacter cavernicola]
MGKTFTCEIGIRWGDSDRLGHVNNTKYFEYAQESRVRFYAECGFKRGGLANHSVVLRQTSMEFIRPLTDKSGPLSIETVVRSIGGSSYSMTHTMADVDGVLCAVASVVMVGFDAHTQTSRTLGESERAALADYLVDGSAP